MAPMITLYLDTVSPFAYEAYYILRHDAAFRGCHITYVPIFLGGLMKMTGNTPPIHIKNKDKWINVERLRWAKAFSVPMAPTMPLNFPVSTLGIMRALAAITHTDGGNQERLIKALDVLFAKFWIDHVPTHQPEALQATLYELFGEKEAERVLADASTIGKKTLLDNTDKAFVDGAFGLPWMHCTNADGMMEGFWGVDHLGQVVQFLDLPKPSSSGWKALL